MNLSTHREPTTTTPSYSPVRRPLGGDTAMDQDGKVCPVCDFYMGDA